MYNVPHIHYRNTRDVIILVVCMSCHTSVRAMFAYTQACAITTSVKPRGTHRNVPIHLDVQGTKSTVLGTKSTMCVNIILINGVPEHVRDVRVMSVTFLVAHTVEWVHVRVIALTGKKGCVRALCNMYASYEQVCLWLPTCSHLKVNLVADRYCTY